jgi:hypothetical protein
VTVSSVRPRPHDGDRAGGGAGSGATAPPRKPQRPLAVIGVIAACAAAGAGLAALTLLAVIGWIAAPHDSLGGGLPGVLRTAVQLWLVGHHVSFGLRGTGRIGLLPLGLVLLPGALLWRSGRWVVRTGRVERLRHVGYAALALAVPYAVLAGALAIASRAPLSTPSSAQAAAAGFGLAFVAGGLGGARALAPWGRLIALLPDRARCLVVGATGALTLLAGAGALLAGAALVTHASGFRLALEQLSPGPVGAALLLLAGLAYLPNAVIWAMAYVIGPGFAVGVGTVVAPTGTVIGPLPVFPLLAALPGTSQGPHAGAGGLAGYGLLALPYLAGAVGGLLTVRTAPSPTIEAAPLWGLAAGVVAGCVTGVLAVVSGGPLGDGRLATVGPSGWQVALVAALEMGVAAAITAGIANWLLIRRRRPRAAALSSGTSAAAAGPDLSGHRIYVNPWAEDEAGTRSVHPAPDPATPFPVPAGAPPAPWATGAPPEGDPPEDEPPEHEPPA